MGQYIYKNRLSQPPSQPLLLYDGACRFCRRWAGRLRCWAHNRFESAAYQDIAHRFPEISRYEFEHYVQFIEPDGTVYQGAAAAFRAAGYRPLLNAGFCLYIKHPLFAGLCDRLYQFVSRNRYHL